MIVPVSSIPLASPQAVKGQWFHHRFRNTGNDGRTWILQKPAIQAEHEYPEFFLKVSACPKKKKESNILDDSGGLGTGVDLRPQPSSRMKISEILNNPQNLSTNAQNSQSSLSQPASPLPLDVQDENGHSNARVENASKPGAAVGGSMMTGNGKVTALQRAPSITVPSNFSDPLQAQAPTLSGQPIAHQHLNSSEMQSNYQQSKIDYNERDTGAPVHPNALPTVLPPVPQQQSAKVRLRTDVESSPHGPYKRARRNTADQSAHSQSDYPDSPNTSASSDYGQWAAYPNSSTPSSLSHGSGSEKGGRSTLKSEPTMILDQHGNAVDGAGDLSSYWKADGTRNDNTPQQLPPPPGRSARSSSGAFNLPNPPRDQISKGASIYPEPTLASISSAGSSAWHSSNGGSSYMNFPPAQEDSLATPKFATLPPPPALRRPTAPKPIPTRVATAPPPPFRRRTTSATELLDHPQIKAALQKHKELSWKALQEQVGGVWEPRGEAKVMFGDGAPASLMKRYSASEILDPTNWSSRAPNNDDGSSNENQQRIWFQMRPQMKGASEVRASSDLNLDGQDTKPRIRGEANDTKMDTSAMGSERSGHEKLISASKELMVNQLFPKYEPYIPGLPVGAIYLRHDHDRFEFRPHGWGRGEDYEEPATPNKLDGDPPSRALVKTPGGTLGGRFIAPNNRRLLQWSLAQARWLFVLSEAPTIERPRIPGGYATPDRLNTFLQQGEVIQRLDGTDSEHLRLEWVLPIRRKLWVSPMEEIVKKCGPNAAPVWDLGGRMLWDETVGQWKFEVCPPTREIREMVKDKDGFEREVIFDICDGGRPRLAWDDFMSSRDYLLALQRKIAKLKIKARERNAVRLPTSATLFPDTHIKKEEDSESNVSGSVVGDGDVAMKEEASDKPRYDIMTDHGQKCAASLLNMMMSVGAMGSGSARTIIATKPAEADLEENAMDLDLGFRGEGSSRNIPIGRNNGFGEIGSGSPSLSPTASHASTVARSISVEEGEGSPSGNETLE